VRRGATWTNEQRRGSARRGATWLGVQRRSLERGGAIRQVVATCVGGGGRRAATTQGTVTPDHETELTLYEGSELTRVFFFFGNGFIPESTGIFHSGAAPFYPLSNQTQNGSILVHS